jgi:murein DD-endopeptidase MepM/ murein hydrolase activator NlpD
MSEQESTPKAPEGGEGTFTQADVDRIVADRLKRERETVKAKFADYDDLKAKAGEKATADERLASLERELETTRREALRRRVQAAHGIADEDADLFLTGTDEETLTAQAKRLAERTPERKSNHVPREGNNPRPPEDELRGFAKQLFQRAD